MHFFLSVPQTASCKIVSRIRIWKIVYKNSYYVLYHVNMSFTRHKLKQIARKDKFSRATRSVTWVGVHQSRGVILKTRANRGQIHSRSCYIPAHVTRHMIIVG